MNVINVYTMSVCKMQARDTNVSGLCMLQTWPSSNTELYGCVRGNQDHAKNHQGTLVTVF
jgi:hypothetical protein